jgi:uncharacterized membrane protein
MIEGETRPLDEEVVVAETKVVDVQPEIDVLPPRPRKVYAGMWGVPEIAAVAVSSLVVLLVMVIYFFWVVPSDRELARNRSEADRLEAEVISARSKYGEITDTQSQVEKLVVSVDDFESRFLPISTTGQTALYQKLNGLIAAYGLVNTSGPDYSPLDTADVGSSNEGSDEKGRSKFRSLYPGVYVSTTVEGSYQNLRRFIREIETGRDFIIVSAIELAPSDTQSEGTRGEGSQAQPNVVQVSPTFNGAPGAQRPNPAAPAPALVRPRQQGKTHGEIVSLRIELAAYFRRPNFVPATTQ